MNRDNQPKSGEGPQRRVPLVESPMKKAKTAIVKIFLVYVIGVMLAWISGIIIRNYPDESLSFAGLGLYICITAIGIVVIGRFSLTLAASTRNPLPTSTIIMLAIVLGFILIVIYVMLIFLILSYTIFNNVFIVPQ